MKPAFKLGKHATSFVYCALGIAALVASMLIASLPAETDFGLLVLLALGPLCLLLFVLPFLQDGS